MRVPYELYWQPAQLATALLYPGDAAGLLRLCVRLGGPSLPRIHATGDGFLVLLPQPSEEAFAGVIRLRTLADHVYLPVDAGLSPALWPDEARALGRSLALIFLPGGQVLTFDPTVRLGPADLIQLPRLPGRAWQSLPKRREQPDHLTGIVLDLPPEAEPDILGPAGEQIASETPQPRPAEGMRRTAGGFLSGLGQGLQWLGRQLNSERLRQMGANLLRQAMRQAPQLTEKLLGKHEAALRDLLRRFREGNLDDALRHAVPLSSEPGRGGTFDDDPHLVARDFRWTSHDLSPGGAAGRMWLSRDELFLELRAQYENAAAEAIRQGDFLRAAAIHGKLLGDWHMAASLLERAGRHHDAARLYLDRLHDHVSASRAFEAAGEIDQAVTLHVQHGRFLDAAELLRRVGEGDRAMHYYLQAAHFEAGQGRYAAAARLLVSRASAPHLAEPYLCQGWKNRPSADAVECLHDLTANYLAGQREEALEKLLDEADAHFAPAGDDAGAARYYNRLIQDAPQRKDLRDRALRGLAGKLRQRAGEGDRGVGVVSLLFAQQGNWDAAMLRDAEVALRAAPGPSAPRLRKASRRITIHPQEVLSVAQAADTGLVVLGFADGCVARYDPVNDRVLGMMTPADPVVSIACSNDGSLIALLRKQNEGHLLMAYEVYPDVWISTLSRPVTGLLDESYHLTPMLHDAQHSPHLGLYTDHYLKQLSGVHLGCPGKHLYVKESILTAFLLPAVHSASTCFLLTLHSDGQVSAFRLLENDWRSLAESIPITHFDDLESPLQPAMLSWVQTHQIRCEIAWCTRSGNIHWTCIELCPVGMRLVDSQYWAAEHCTAVALLDANRLAAVHSRGISWLRTDGGTPRVQDRSEIALPDAIAAFASPRTAELLVVTQHGDIVRVPLPG